MIRVRRFGVVRTSNLSAVVYFILTAIFIIPIALIIAAAPEVTITTPDGVQTTRIDVGPGILVLLVVPFIYALAGWIFTALACLIYNLAARITGGIEVEVERREPPPQPAVVGNWGPPR